MIKIRLSPLVYSFLFVRDPIAANQKHFENLVHLFVAPRNKFVQLSNTTVPDHWVAVKVTLSNAFLANCKAPHIPEQMNVRLNTMLESYILDKFYELSNLKLHYTKSVEQSLDETRLLLEIPEDLLSYEAALKGFQRWREKNKGIKIYKNETKNNRHGASVATGG